MHKALKILFCVFAIFVSASAMAGNVQKINIQGNQRVEQSTIKEYLEIQVGERYSQEKQSKAVKALYATTLFETIDITFHSGVLTVKVQETPFVSKVAFNGNNKIKTSLTCFYFVLSYSRGEKYSL